MLSQLSYAPRRQSDQIADHRIDVRVGLLRLERRTSVLSGLRSNQLSYRPADGTPQDDIPRQPKSEKQPTL
jgi:hypothetical protein